MATVPAACAGVVTVTDVDVERTTVPGVVPNVTLVTFVKAVPTMVTIVPPVVVPPDGEKDAMAGVVVAPSATEDKDKAPQVTPTATTAKPTISLDSRPTFNSFRLLVHHVSRTCLRIFHQKGIFCHRIQGDWTW